MWGPNQKTWRRSARVAVAVAITGAAGFGIVHAGGIGGGGFLPFPGGPYPTVIGCAHNGNGDLRVVSTASACHTDEHPVTFAGPQAPQSVTVDCSVGQSLDNAISAAILNLPLTINVKGTCAEDNVRINRDWVALQAVSPGDGIHGSLSLIDAQHVDIAGITLTGCCGLNALNGSSFEADNITIGNGSAVTLGQGSAGVLNQPTADSTCLNACFSVQENSSITLVGGSIAANGDVAVVAHSGQATLSGVTITTSKDGVTVSDGGSAFLNNDSIDGNLNQGVSADNGGSVFIQGGSITNNGGVGVNVAGGAVHFEAATNIANNGWHGVAVSDGGKVFLGSQIKIQSNKGNGVDLRDVSVADFTSSNPPYEIPGQISGNTGWGVFCHTAPSIAMTTGDPAGWTISGNSSGGNNCSNAS